MKNYSLYLVPGFLTDKTIYKEFLCDERFDCEVLEFLPPLDKDEVIEDYAKRMAQKIETNKKVVLLGTSFGGILSIEISKHVPVEKIIFISSVKNRKELNPLMRIEKGSSLLDYVPSKMVRNTIKAGYSVGSKLFSNLKEIDDEDIEKMINRVDGKLEKWIIKKIKNWKGENQIQDFLHLHGDKDNIFPVKNIENFELIEGGNHNMILVKSQEIRDRVAKYLYDN